MEITEAMCWKLLENHYNGRGEKKLQHTRRVLDYCQKIAAHLGDAAAVDLQLLRRAAILHDIAKLDDDKKHHKKAKKAISEEFQHLNGREPEAGELDSLTAVIQVHKGDFDPPEGVAMEAAILRMADKIDKFYRKKSDAGEAYGKNLGDISVYFAAHSQAFSKSAAPFKAACDAVMQEVPDFK